MDSSDPTFSIRGNVLVVEDDPDCGASIATVLAEKGYGVRLAKSHNEAVIAMTRYLYDYIILDVQMPGMSIAEFLSVLSAGAANKARIILTSAEKDVCDEARKHNIVHWLAKPFTPEQLLTLLVMIKSSSNLPAVSEMNFE